MKTFNSQVNEKAVEDEMYKIILNGMISFPKGYKDLGDEEETSMHIGMDVAGGSGYINWFLEDDFFEYMGKAVPALTMKGYYQKLSSETETLFVYKSEKNSEKVESSIEYECCYCGKRLEDGSGYFSEKFGNQFCNEEEYIRYMIEELSFNDEYDENELMKMTTEQLEELLDEAWEDDEDNDD